MNNVVPTSAASPFDGLMGEDGRWSARDLMEAAGYAKWENFEEAISRAIQSITNTEDGVSAGHHVIPDVRKYEDATAFGGFRKSKDYRLTRYGAYMVFMNGDPRKAEIAAAQAYFATKTREAEVQQGPASIPQTYAQALRAAADAAEAQERAELEAAQAKQALAISAPKAERYDNLMNAEGLVGMRAVADMLDVDVKFLTNWLVSQGIFRKEVSAGQKNGRNMPRRGYQSSGYFEVRMEDNGKVKYQVAYATSKGLDLILEKWSY